MRDKDGNRLFKTVTVKVIPAEGHKTISRIFRADPGKRYKTSAIEQITDSVIEWLDNTYPYWNFRMVEIGPNEVKFIYDGLRDEPVRAENRP